MKDTQVKDIQSQIEFFKILREILSKRGNPVENKQINIFTTNYDLVPELAIEYLNIDYNDGFKGRISPRFSTANYGNIQIKNLISSNNKTEIESINLYKIHGLLLWKKGKKLNTEFLFGYGELINKIYEEYKNKFFENDFNEIKKCIDNDNMEELKNIKTDGEGIFKELTNIFNIVWPTKKKFYNSVLNMNYYELLRIFSNELEKIKTYF